jgi:hypothetical protein
VDPAASLTTREPASRNRLLGIDGTATSSTVRGGCRPPTVRPSIGPCRPALEFAGTANAAGGLKSRGWHVTGHRGEAGLAQVIRSVHRRAMTRPISGGM